MHAGHQDWFSRTQVEAEPESCTQSEELAGHKFTWIWESENQNLCCLACVWIFFSLLLADSSYIKMSLRHGCFVVGESTPAGRRVKRQPYPHLVEEVTNPKVSSPTLEMRQSCFPPTNWRLSIGKSLS